MKRGIQELNNASKRGGVLQRMGLTLMELVVVMGVLAALAAIVVPLFPNLLRRAHKVTDATQTSEISKALQLYQAAFLSYPDGFDLLTDGTTFPAYLPADGGAPFGDFVELGTLEPEEIAALHRVGIDHVAVLASDSAVAGTPADPGPPAVPAVPGLDGFHPTMNPYAADGTTAIDGGSLEFAVLVNATARVHNFTLKNAIDADPTAKFIVLGVGPRCSMVSQTIQDAPTSVPQDKGFTPDTLYSRVGVIFKVSGTEVGRTERARFICAVALEDDELESTEKDTVGYYGVAQGTQP